MVIRCAYTRPMAQFILVALALLLVVEKASGAPYAVADKPSIIAVGDGLTESAFSSVNNGWGLLHATKIRPKGDSVHHKAQARDRQIEQLLKVMRHDGNDIGQHNIASCMPVTPAPAAHMIR